MKRVLFIGNRCDVWTEILNDADLVIVLTVAVAKSGLHEAVMQFDVPLKIVTSKKETLQIIQETEFDILISNGCPYVLPVSQLKKCGQLFINIHPSLLPELRGKHPANGAILFDHDVVGATMHFMDDGVDTGRVIAQEQMRLTPDVDLGLLYKCLFSLEADAFRKGMVFLREHDYKYKGRLQQGEGSYFSRQASDMCVNLITSKRVDILRQIRSYGISGQGVSCLLNDVLVRVYAAEPIDNSYVVQKYKDSPVGSVILEYDDALVTKCLDGLLKFTKFAKQGNKFA